MTETYLGRTVRIEPTASVTGPGNTVADDDTLDVAQAVDTLTTEEERDDAEQTEEGEAEGGDNEEADGARQNAEADANGNRTATEEAQGDAEARAVRNEGRRRSSHTQTHRR